MHTKLRSVNKKLLILIGICLAAIILSNILYVNIFPVVPKSGVSKTLFDDSSYWWNVIVYTIHPLIVIVIPWMALLPLILYLLSLHPFTKTSRVRFILLHLSTCFLFSLAQIFIHMFFEPDTGVYHGDFFYRLILGILDYFYKNVVFYIGVIAVAQAAAYFRQLRQKELNEARLAESLANARLGSLKMKLQPHFIFNTLQSINVLMLDRQTESASEMISRLAHLLRHSIDMDDTQMVTVENELDTIQNYLEIEKVRFKDRLKLEKNIDPLVKNALIPGLILQPLIENAVKHGIAKKMGSSRICIEINREDNFLKISIKNDGPGLPPNWNVDKNAGFGLQVTKKRLELIYKNNYTFSFKNSEEGGVCAEIKIPFSEEILSVRKAAEK